VEELQQIMQDKDLTLQAKAIYIYFLQNSNGEKSFKLKSPSAIQNELGIGSHTYYSHVHKLIDSGYIKIQQTRNEKNRYSGVKCIFLNGGKENEQ
jgi:hypothetical protein